MKTALLFAGQGAQAVGMGRDLAAKFAACKKIFEIASDILGFDLARICFEGPEAELTRTENAQPAIFVVSWACLEALRVQLGARQVIFLFEACAGLSLGELTALVAADAMSFASGLRLVRTRGRLMQEACNQTAGAMASVIGLDEARVEEICRQCNVELANLNCPGQIVISGAKEEIAKAIPKLESAGARRVLPLNVAGAYHSRLMASAVPELEMALREVEFRAPEKIVVSNLTAKPMESVEEIRALLARQIVAPVRWEASMRWLLANGFNRFIELGPGNVLSGLLRRIDKSVVIVNIADVASLEKATALLASE